MSRREVNIRPRDLLLLWLKIQPLLTSRIRIKVLRHWLHGGQPRRLASRRRMRSRRRSLQTRIPVITVTQNVDVLILRLQKGLVQPCSRLRRRHPTNRIPRILQIRRNEIIVSRLLMLILESYTRSWSRCNWCKSWVILTAGGRCRSETSWLRTGYVMPIVPSQSIVMVFLLLLLRLNGDSREVWVLGMLIELRLRMRLLLFERVRNWATSRRREGVSQLRFFVGTIARGISGRYSKIL